MHFIENNNKNLPWLPWAIVKVSIIQWQKIYIMENKTIPFVQLQGLQEANIHKRSTIEWLAIGLFYYKYSIWYILFH